VAVTLAFSARDFALSVSPSSVTISRGQSAKYTVSVSVAGGSVGNVSLTVAGLPNGTTAAFSPNPAGSPGSSALTVRRRRRPGAGPTPCGSPGPAVLWFITPLRRSPSGSERGYAPMTRHRPGLGQQPRRPACEGRAGGRAAPVIR